MSGHPAGPQICAQDGASGLARKASKASLTFSSEEFGSSHVWAFSSSVICCVMSKSWYSEVVPAERWVWSLSGAEGPNSWDLGMQIASKNGFAVYPLTQTQVRCFNYQRG